MESTHTKDGNTVIEVPNSFKSKLIDVRVNPDLFHGLFTIENVQINDDYFADIWIQTYNISQLDFIQLISM